MAALIPEPALAGAALFPLRSVGAAGPVADVVPAAELERRLLDWQESHPGHAVLFTGGRDDLVRHADLLVGLIGRLGIRSFGVAVWPGRG